MQHNIHATAEATLRRIFISLSKKYPTIGSDSVWDAIEDSVEAWLKYPAGKQTDGLLYTIVKRNLYHVANDARRKRTLSTEALHEKGIHLSSQVNIEAVFSDSETLKQLMATLLQNEKELVTMRLDEISFEEIARLTGEKKNTLEKRYSRIIAKLAKVARKDMEETKTKVDATQTRSAITKQNKRK